MSHQDSGIQLNIEFFNQTGDFIMVNESEGRLTFPIGRRGCQGTGLSPL